MSGVRRTVTGFAALGAATLASQIIGFFVLTVVARRLGPDGLGSFSFAMNLAGYFAIPANFGVTALAVRDLARSPDQTRRVSGEVLVLQTALGLVPYALLVALTPVLAADADSRRLLPVVGLTFLLEAYSLQWVLYAGQRFLAAAVTRVAGSLTYAVLVLALIGDRDDPLRLGWIHIAGVVVTTVLSLLAVVRHSGRPVVRRDIRTLVRRFRGGVPLGISAVMISIYYTVDSVMLGYLDGTATVGQYAVAYKLPLAILAFAGLWGSVLFPQFSAVAERDRGELRGQLGLFASLSLVASLPLLAGAIVVGPDLVPQLFGAEYGPAGTPFVLLMGAAALVVFTINYGTTAIAIGDERHYAIAVTLGAVLNVVVNLATIPLFGMTGAACATIAAEIVVFGYVALRVHRLLGRPPLERPRIVRALAATIAMVAVLLVLPAGLTPAGHVAVGAFVFALVAAALRVVRPDEVRALVPR